MFHGLNQQIIAGLVGFAAAFGLMPAVMAVARRFEMLDQPGHRRLHSVAVPRLGGVGIFGGTLIGSAVALLLGTTSGDIGGAIATNAGILPGVFTGCLVVFATGVVDDLRGVPPIAKLAAQTLAAVAAIQYGFTIDHITLTGHSSLSLGVFAVPVTLLWIVGMTNAFNLIDGVDGLAGTFALIALTVAMGVDVYLHDNSGLLVSSAILGAVFAFLRYNKFPAKIFLGDSGSMLLGYFLSIRLVTSATSADGNLFFVVPLFALAYPLVDTFIAMARRWLRGEPLSRADGRHVHHQMLALELSAPRTVELLGFFFFGVALIGVSIAFAPPQVTFSLVTGAITLVFLTSFYGFRWLGYHEFVEFGSSITSVVVNARSQVRGRIRAYEVATRLLDARTLQEISETLGDSAGDLGLVEVTLLQNPGAVHAPASRQISPPSQRLFRVDYPVAWEENGRTREVILRLWCERPKQNKRTGAERIASRLASSIEVWLANNPGAVPHMDEDAKRGSHRTSLHGE